MTGAFRVLPGIVLLLTCTATLSFGEGPVGYATGVNVAPVSIDNENYSIYATHSVNGQDERLVHFIPPGTPNEIYFKVADAEAISTAITRALAIENAAAGTITQGGQTQSISLVYVVIHQAWLTSVRISGRWRTTLKREGVPAFGRDYSSAGLRQLASYLALGVAFANALP